MASPGQSFREYEQAGWEDPDVAAKYDEHLSELTTQSVDALLGAADIGEGSRVLDLATGAGYAAAAAAQRGAMAIGVDFSAVQVSLARARYPEVRFEQADAQALPFSAESFDAVVSGFGMCHFARPELALREAFRVLKREGRVAFTVWDMPERAVAFGVLYAAIHAHGTLDVGLPAGPDYFLFSDVERSAQALLSAGFVAASCRRVPQLWCVSDPDDIFEAFSNATVRAGATLRQQGLRAREAIRAALRNAIAAYRCGESYHVPMPAMLSAAVKPGW